MCRELNLTAAAINRAVATWSSDPAVEAQVQALHDALQQAQVLLNSTLEAVPEKLTAELTMQIFNEMARATTKVVGDIIHDLQEAQVENATSPEMWQAK